MSAESNAFQRLYSAEETRALDRAAIERHGIAGIRLMKRAGEAAFSTLIEKWPSARKLSVFCGAGNNAGDGYIVAGLARDRGIDAVVMQIGSASRLKGDAALARDWARERGVLPHEITGSDAIVVEGDVVVDALLGTGIDGAPRPDYAGAIAAINGSARPVLALDLPSGLSADTGRARGAVVRASATVMFIGAKRGIFTADGPDCAGHVRFVGLDVPAAVYESVLGIEALRWEALCHELSPRPRGAFKNRFGHVLVIGGELGMGGAVAMTSEAALRAGAGLVAVATRGAHVPAILARRPEVMARGIDGAAGLDDMLTRATVLAVGPGIGQSGWAHDLYTRALAAGKPTVLDADALNLLAERRNVLPEHVVLTPHPGEAGRLLGCSTAEVENDRFAAAEALARRYAATVVLKGAGSLVAVPGRVIGLCLDGNPAMATAGMGDVLTGVIAGLLAQGLAPENAARMGVTLHAAAADHSARADGPRGLLAADVLAALRGLLNARERA